MNTTYQKNDTGERAKVNLAQINSRAEIVNKRKKESFRKLKQCQNEGNNRVKLWQVESKNLIT